MISERRSTPSFHLNFSDIEPGKTPVSFFTMIPAATHSHPKIPHVIGRDSFSFPSFSSFFVFSFSSNAASFFSPQFHKNGNLEILLYHHFFTQVHAPLNVSFTPSIELFIFHQSSIGPVSHAPAMIPVCIAPFFFPISAMSLSKYPSVISVASSLAFIIF